MTQEKNTNTSKLRVICTQKGGICKKNKNKNKVQIRKIQIHIQTSKYQFYCKELAGAGNDATHS